MPVVLYDFEIGYAPKIGLLDEEAPHIRLGARVIILWGEISAHLGGSSRSLGCPFVVRSALP